MPEGDTIFRTAARLRVVLDGSFVRAVTIPDSTWDPSALNGCRVAATEARGKHLLIHLGDEHVIHSHLGMTGSWHIYRPDQAWQKPAQRAALVLDVGEHVCVCFSPKKLELLTKSQLPHHPHLSRLGPDLLGAHFDLETALFRFRRCNLLPIGEAVMNQTIVCGIGNVYKSEVLFLRRLNPFLRGQQLSDDEIRDVLQTAQQLMRRNLAGSPRRTRFGRDGQRLWVYGRSGQPCLKCATPIQIRRQGDLGRTTYWCPDCQPAQGEV